MRALILGPNEKAAIDQVVAYAMETQNWFHPGTDAAPGDDPRYVARIPDGFRCVFSFTRSKGKLYRHLSVSVGCVGEDVFPSPAAMVALAQEFGFTASATSPSLDLASRIENDGWLCSRAVPNCIALIQQVG